MQGDSTPVELMTKNVNRRTLDKMAALLQQHLKKDGLRPTSLHLQTASGYPVVSFHSCVVPQLLHFLLLSLMVFPFFDFLCALDHSSNAVALAPVLFRHPKNHCPCFSGGGLVVVAVVVCACVLCLRVCHKRVKESSQQDGGQGLSPSSRSVVT